MVPNSHVNYVVKVDGTEKTYHVDMMQELVSRAPDLVPDTISVNDSDTLTKSNVVDKSLKASDSVLIGTASSPFLNSFEPYTCEFSKPLVIPASSVSIIHEDSDPIDPGYANDFSNIILPSLVQKETAQDVKVNPDLSPEQKSDIQSLLEEFHTVFSDVPAMTNCIEHVIKLSSNEPIKLKPYPLPFTSQQVVRDEVCSMLELDVIEPSDSPYC